MVSANIKYLGTLPGLAKLGTIVLGVFAVGLGGHGYEKSLYNIVWRFATAIVSNVPGVELDPDAPGLQREAFFLSIVGLFLIFSVLSLLCHILNEELSYTKTNKMVDIGIHAAGALLLIIAGSLMIASANKIDDFCHIIPDDATDSPDEIERILSKAKSDSDDIRCQYQGEKIFGGIFGILNSFAFGFVALVGVLRLNNNESIQSTA
jgi:hypothetical protein